MQRHAVPPEEDDDDNNNLNRSAAHEGQPLRQHISFEESQSFGDHEWRPWKRPVGWRRVAVLMVSVAAVTLGLITTTMHRRPHIVPVQHASEHYLDIGNGMSLWYRLWGNRESGIPVIFVHGGPGNCIADYGYGNARFFDKNKFFVIEVDQRGTGKSQPSVRDDCRNMKYYYNISIDQMSHDYELIRKELKIDTWLVFGEFSRCY